MRDEMVFAPAKSPNLREVVYESIKEAIVNGLIPAGSRLSEIDLSRQFDVSRTPVREAIRQLTETGLVRITARKGAYVLLPTAKDTWDLYEIRIALELISVEHLCAKPPRELLLRFRDLFEGVSDDWDARKFMEMDEAFHAELSQNAENNFLNVMLGRVGAIIQICRHYVIGSIPKVGSSMEHIAIIDAILEGRAETAKEKMRVHLNHTRDALLEYINKHPEATTYPGE